MSHLRDALSQCWKNIQGNLFYWLEEELGPLTTKQQQLVTVLEISRVENFICSYRGWPGRPPNDRIAIAKAFIAKVVYVMPSTRVLLDRLKSDITLRRICGWEKQSQIPSESCFSRAFAEFSQSELPQIIHQSIIQATYKDQLVGHISRDSSAIEAREKPLKKAKKCKSAISKAILGRPKKGEEKPKTLTRLQQQLSMTSDEMLNDLPKACDVGTKKNSKGYKETWIGYKLHLDVADGQIPISCIVTSASVHDSQVAIPLATITAKRITNLYDLMDAAYDCEEIKLYSQSLGHVPIIDINTRRNTHLKAELLAENQRRDFLNFTDPQQQRYNERTTAERTFSRLKDEFGARFVRVRGHAKVACHLGFGLLALSIDQLMRFVT